MVQVLFGCKAQRAIGWWASLRDIFLYRGGLPVTWRGLAPCAGVLHPILIQQPYIASGLKPPYYPSRKRRIVHGVCCIGPTLAKLVALGSARACQQAATQRQTELHVCLLQWGPDKASSRDPSQTASRQTAIVKAVVDRR